VPGDQGVKVVVEGGDALIGVPTDVVDVLCAAVGYAELMPAGAVILDG
jgi:hypothetical protein